MTDVPNLSPHHDPASVMQPIADRLRRVRSAARASLVLASVAWLVSVVLLYLVAAGTLDYALRMPAWLRAAGWIAAAATLGIAAWRRVLPAWRFNPPLTEVALRFERTEEGRRAGLAGVLASALELARADAGAPPAARWMSARAVAAAAGRFDAVAGTPLLRRDRNAGILLQLASAGLLAAGAVWSVGTTLSRVALARVAAPWSGAQWPRQTQLADATGVEVHALGSALPLRAALVRSSVPLERAGVAARYRVIRSGEPGPWRRALLAPQFRPVRVIGGVTGELFEQLIEPGVLGVATRDAGPAELEYGFESLDDATPLSRVRLVEPPAVVGAEATLSLPAYASGAGSRRFAAGDHDLGPGGDQRAIVGPVLAGSRVEFTVRFNKPLPVPRVEDADTRAAWLARSFPGADFGPDPVVTASERAWSVAWTLRSTTRAVVAPLDEYGLGARDEAAFTFDAVEDRPPTAAVTVPEQDEAVLASAVLLAAGEGRDDVGVASLGLEVQAARRPGGSMGAPAEPSGEPATLPAGAPEGLDATQVRVAGRVALEPHRLRPGDELWIFAVAADGFDLDGMRHEPVRSAPRRLRVVTADELVEQMRRELQGVRQAAIRLDQDQGELAAAAARGFVSEEERHRQTALGPRIEQQGEIVDRLLERAHRNVLDDAGLTGQLEDARSLLSEAQRSAEQAGAGLDEAAQHAPTPELTELAPEQARRVREAQEQARDRLGRLIDLLDRGEDSWSARRGLQRLLDRQRELAARTESAGRRTTGREAEELSARDREELERLSREQRELADQARAALDQLAERSEQMRQADAAQAAAMQQAAQRGRQSQVPERMEQAARDTARNQTGTAQEQQQQAIDSLQRMLDDLDNAERNRDESLRRLLASLIQSLDALIASQERELSALASATGGARPFDGLDAGMIRLHQNTLGVLGEAKAAFRETAGVARLIEQASGSQAAAAADLRATPPDAEGADRHEQASLRDLRAARDEAARVERDAAGRDQDRKRRELRRVYRETLEQQVVLRDETAPMLGRDPDRRDRLRLRSLGERQDGLREALADLRRRTEELADAEVFGLAHDRLEGVMGSAAQRLRAGQAPAAVGRDQDAAVEVLRTLVEALAESASRGDEFRDADEGGGGGEGGGAGQTPPLIPDLAELRVLKGLQQQAAGATRALDEAADAVTPGEIEALGRLQEQLAERGRALIEKLQRQGRGNDRPRTPADREERP